jgi:hypothetical protein
MAAVDLATVPGLADFSSYMDESEQRLAALLVGMGQQALFRDWVVGADVPAKKAFFEQVRGLERGYPGGIRQYVENARKLLRDSAAEVNPFEGYTPRVRHACRSTSRVLRCRAPRSRPARCIDSTAAVL